MGTVWVARHLQLDIELAIKLRAEGDAAADPRGEWRFKREAQLAAQLRSPHVVHIYDFAVEAGQPYIVMELLVGEDLKSRLERTGRLPLPQVATLLGQAAAGLACIHALGIVHRDLKPGNLFLARSEAHEVLKILDFGIAKHHEPPPSGDDTTAGFVLGSAAYMSPEQVRGVVIDRRADVWALAVVAFQAITGVQPFKGDSYVDTVQRICSGRSPRPSEHASGLSREIDDFFAKAFARELEERFQTACELAESFAKLHTDEPPSLPKVSSNKPNARGVTEGSDEQRPLVWRQGATRSLRVTSSPPVDAPDVSASESRRAPALDSDQPRLKTNAARMVDKGSSLASGIRIVYTDGGVVMAELGRVFVSLYRTNARPARVATQRAGLDAFVQRHPEGVAFLVMVEATTEPPDADVRRSLAAIGNSYGASLKCIACVAEGSILRSAIFRMVLASIRHLGYFQALAAHFNSLAAATGWMAKHVRIPSQDRFIKQVETMRTHLDA